MDKRQYDFLIREEFKGKKIEVMTEDGEISLNIPENANFLDVNPYEDGEECLGNQGDSQKQQINYYDKYGKYLTTEDLDRQIRTSEIMRTLEKLLLKQY